MAAFDPNISDEALESWRLVQDEPADLVAEALLSSRYSHVVYPLLAQIAKNSDVASVELFNRAHPELAKDSEFGDLAGLLSTYFADTKLFPHEQEELRAIRSGCDFFELHVADGLMALTFRSLIKQYAAARATYVLTNTKLLVDYPHRRMVETLQFVADVMDANGLEPDGRAIRSIQKLRLIHALVRHRINRSRNTPMQGESAVASTWDPTWGAPINQQDMIFAVHTFSVEVIDGLTACGVKISDDKKEDIYKTWHIYGRALGVREELNPTTYAEGKALQERIYAKEFHEHENAEMLTKPLFEFAKQLLRTNSVKETYAMALRYNDPKDYLPIFYAILKTPILEANLFYLVWFFFFNQLSIWWHGVKTRWLAQLSKEEKSQAHYLALRNVSVIQALVDVHKTWTGRDFAVSDGFGSSAAKLDAKEIASQPDPIERIKNDFRILIGKIKNDFNVFIEGIKNEWKNLIDRIKKLLQG